MGARREGENPRGVEAAGRAHALPVHHRGEGVLRPRVSCHGEREGACSYYPIELAQLLSVYNFGFGASFLVLPAYLSVPFVFSNV